MLHVLVLGSVQVNRNGSSPVPISPKQAVVLTHLVMAAGHTVPTRTLIDSLWELPPKDPLHALQAHVSRLRESLESEIEFLPGGYRLEPRNIELDASRFTRLCEHGQQLLRSGSPQAARDRLNEALSLWRGEPFGHLNGLDGLRHDAVRLTALRHSALGDRIDADLLTGNTGSLAVELRVLLEEHPLHERFWRQLMAVMYVEQRVNEALEVFQQAREILVDQLGSEPGELLDGLHQLILRDAPADSVVAFATDSLPANTASSASRVDGLLGRSHELTVLNDAWQTARERLQVVTITGEPGIGKTRLATAFAERLQADDVSVSFGRCDEYTDVPYQAFLTMLPDLVTPPRSASAHLSHDSGSERYQFFDAVAQRLSEASAAAPICLVIDDLQWSDPETLLLVKHLLRTPRSMRILLLITLRDRQSSPAGLPEDLFGGVLRQSETVHQLLLQSLNRGEIGQLLAAELERTDAKVDLSEHLIDQVVVASGGNPLFVLELARQQAQLLPSSSTDARRIGHELPSGLRAAITERLDQLPEAIRTRLEFAAVIGRVFDPLVLAELTGSDLATLDELLDIVTYARLVEPVPGHRTAYRFCHDVVRTALTEAMSPIRRAAVHHRIAVAIEQKYGHDATKHFHELGRHYAAAVPVTGSSGKASHYLKLAGDVALAQLAPALAVDCYLQARDLAPADASYEDACDLLIALGTAQFHAGYAEHRETLLTAARLAHESGDSPRLTLAAVANNRGWYSSTSEVDAERVTVIEAALEACPQDDLVSRTKLLGSWAIENVRDVTRRDLAIERSIQSIELAEAIGDEILLAQTLSQRYSVAYATFSDPHGCVEISKRIYAIAHSRDEPSLQLNAVIALAQATMMVGDFNTADSALARSIELGEALDQPARLWLARSWESTRVAMRGDLERAEALAVSTLELGLEAAQPDAFTWFAGQLFVLRQLSGRLSELIEEIETEVKSHSGIIPAWRAAYAVALVEVERHDEAEELLIEFVNDRFQQLPHDMLWLHGMAYLCEVADQLELVEAAKPLYEELEPYAGMIAHNGTIDAGPVDLQLGRMARLFGAYDAAARHFDSAAAFCRRSDAPLWLARVEASARQIPLA